MSVSVAFLFIGGPHQVFHLAPVAAELSRNHGFRIECLFEGVETGAALEQVRRDLDAKKMALKRVSAPRWAERLARRLNARSTIKLPLLLRLALRLRQVDAVITPERTSAFLRRLGVRRPMLIHFRHGAGDRAPASETRLGLFDLVVVPGPKDAERAREYLPAASIRETGYIKLNYLNRAAPPPRLFANRRPIVIYNPHFDASLSSWPQAKSVIAAFAGQDRYNLIVAPHIRLAMDMDDDELAAWQALAVPGRIIVDLASPRLLDMTYIRAADVYLGDMSSQLYEFLSKPRPVAFLNTHDAAWRDNPRYAGWHLGEVVDGPGDVIAAIDRARSGHTAIVSRQRQAVKVAFGDYRGASVRGAVIVAEAVASRASAMLT